MRIEQIQAFLSVAETGSFQVAAQQCQVTQSTVSRQVQALEVELDAPLFHRSAQAKLTVAGERLLPKARRIYQDWVQVSKDIADLMAGKQPELCVAAIQSVCATVLPPVLQQFCAEYPQVQLRVTALGSDRSLKVLRDGLVDLAIVMDNPRLTSQSEMVVTPLFEEPIEVLMAADHDLAAQPEIEWEALSRFPHIVFKDGYGMQRLVQQQFQNRGEVFNPVMELNTLDAFRGVIRQGNFVALLPQAALAECCHDPTVAVRPTSQPVLTRSVVLVTTRDRLVIPPIQRFHALVQSLATPTRLRPLPTAVA
ncbi:LysR family transcriptional regulator [Nodosilinea sp. LEGE 07088]|uniref:LysR family transcriptional regulator n=1 Tax=Nodosilinea sp. LEGE 07088 TaxID=2777968 RepID=UPI00187FA143|nr:LysR family transcriptional regulator [Nodosilinea sp. LEGE 07088]MBE9139710.1 LysR family transcriptional regulator [Nodosilinea sp. LEGE 07088]